MERLKNFGSFRRRAGEPARYHTNSILSDGVVWRAFFVAAAMLVLLMAVVPS